MDHHDHNGQNWYLFAHDYHLDVDRHLVNLIIINYIFVHFRAVVLGKKLKVFTLGRRNHNARKHHSFGQHCLKIYPAIYWSNLLTSYWKNLIPEFQPRIQLDGWVFGSDDVVELFSRRTRQDQLSRLLKASFWSNYNRHSYRMKQ